MKSKPTGFVAKCQCGVYIGALDYDRTDRKEAGQLMGQWLADGCTVEPRFESTWSEMIKPCECNKPAHSATCATRAFSGRPNKCNCGVAP